MKSKRADSLNSNDYKKEREHNLLGLYAGLIVILVLMAFIILVFMPHILVPNPAEPERKSVEYVLPAR